MIRYILITQALLGVLWATSPAEARHRHHPRCPLGSILRVSMGTCERKARSVYYSRPARETRSERRARVREARLERTKERLERSSGLTYARVIPAPPERPAVPPQPDPVAACPQPVEIVISLPMDVPSSIMLHPKPLTRFTELRQ